MALPRPPLNPSAPIPNNPFYSPQTNYIQGSTGPLIVGAGLSVNYTTGTLSATGGGGGGGVTLVNTGTGLTGGPITTSGTVSLNNTTVIPGTYTFATLTVDANGRLTAANSGVTPVSSVTGTAPITVTGTTARVVSIAAASTSSAGAVQLYNGTNSTSTTLALTAAQGYSLQSQIDALLIASNLTLAGTFDADAGVVLTATTDGTAQGFVSGAALPAPAAGNTDYFVIATVGGTFDPPGPTGPLTVTAGDWILSSGTQWDLLDIGPTVLYATTTVAGSVCLSTDALAQAGTDTLTALTPAAARSAYIPNSCYPAKGDLIGGTSVANTPVTVAIGTAGQVLTVDATAPTGFTWKNGAAGTVTSIDTGTGLNGGPITSSGTIALSNTAVTAGSYTNPAITVDAQGRITAASSGSAGLTALTGTAPIAVTTGSSPVVSIGSSSTTALGAVQLTNALDNTSETLALTACAGKSLQDQITGLVVAGTIELAGTIDASTGFVASVTSVGTADGYTVGAVLPAASSTTNNTYVIVTTPGTMTPPGGAPTAATRGDYFLVSEVSLGTYEWTFLNVGFDAPAATTTVAGIVCLATDALAQAGTDATTALTPAAATSAFIPKTCVTAKGTLITGTAANTPAGLPVGADGCVLFACSAASTGLCWGPGVGPATPTALGTVLGRVDLGSGGLGFQALNSLTTGLFNVGIGEDAGRSITTGNRNVAVGPLALCSVTAVSDNIGIGVEALRRNTTGTANIAIGTTSLVFNTTGVSNVAIGCDAGRAITVGSGNVLVGVAAGQNGSTLGRSVAIGEFAMQNGGTSQCNTALGWNALSNSTGGFNVAVGACAGSFITTGVNNVIIGTGVQAAFGDQSGQLAIGWANCCWICGDANKHIKPGAGIRDCANNLGTAGQVLTSTGGAIQWSSAASPIQRASNPFFLAGGTTVITFAPDTNNGRAVQFWVTGVKSNDGRAQIRTGTWIRDFGNNIYDIPWGSGSGGLLGLEDPGSGTPGIRIRNNSGVSMNLNVAWLPIWS